MRLMHNVFFTLFDQSPSAVDKLIASCKKYLTNQPGIVSFAVGARETSMTRDVNDLEWNVGLHILFQDRAAHDAYQDDASHHKFVAENKPTWSKVRVFDSAV